MESSFTYCSQWVIADCFFLTLVMSSTDVIISCILTNWAGKKRKNSQKYNTVLMSRIFLEKNEPLWVWFLGHEEKWGINSKLGALSSLTCSTYTKIGTIQRRLAWPLRKDDTQNREAFHIFWLHYLYLSIDAIWFDVYFSKFWEKWAKTWSSFKVLSEAPMQVQIKYLFILVGC